MIKITCDLCDKEIRPNEVLRITFLDGEHPHNGSTMYKTVDCCLKCAVELNASELRVDKEFDSFRRDIQAFNKLSALLDDI